jgi:phenylacetate-coenzyme A ligase PaaK-like adenylate-forming protein
VTVAPPTVRDRQVEAILARLPEHAARLDWGAGELAEHQRGRLRWLLAVAKEQSPFHASRLRHVDPDRFELDDLPSLPVMTKAEMMGAFDDVVTDRRLDRALVEAHLAGLGVEADHLLDEHMVMASGGSSGLRGVFVYGFDAFVDFVLSLTRVPLTRLRSLVPEGSPPVPAALVAAAGSMHGTGALAAVAGRGGPLHMHLVPGALPLAEQVARLQDIQPLVLVGYPGLLARLAEEQLAGRLAITPLTVSCTSEPLTPPAAAAIERAFGVAPSNTFASTEGLCGMAEPGEAAVTFASDGCIAELVDDDGRPVPPGTPSAKVLVTNLLNPVQPLIRYELTDQLCRVVEPPVGHGHLRATVVGRQDPPFRYREAEVHPIALRSVLVGDASVLEHQVRQTHRGIDVDVVVTDGFDADRLAERLAERLATALERAGLAEPEVRVHRVDAVDRRGPAGKARRFIPLD